MSYLTNTSNLVVTTGNIGYSTIVDFKSYPCAAIQINWSGTAVACQMAVQFSNDGITFNDNPDSVTTCSGSSGAQDYNIPKNGFLYFRIRISALTGGTVTATVISNQKNL